MYSKFVLERFIWCWNTRKHTTICNEIADSCNSANLLCQEPDELPILADSELLKEIKAAPNEKDQVLISPDLKFRFLKVHHFDANYLDFRKQDILRFANCLHILHAIAVK